MDSAIGLHDGSSPWKLQLAGPNGTSEVILRAQIDPRRISPEMIATGVAALKVADSHGLPAPRVIACDLNGHEAGFPASLETLLAGDSGWPWPEDASVARLREAGAAIARVHRVPLQPQDHLPLRVRPIEVDDFAMQRRWAFYRASRKDDRPQVVAAFREFTAWPEAPAKWVLSNVRSSPLLHLADEVVRLTRTAPGL